ncbi:hypothetical protein [Actinoplanes sp. NPDC051859]
MIDFLLGTLLIVSMLITMIVLTPPSHRGSGHMHFWHHRHRH